MIYSELSKLDGEDGFSFNAGTLTGEFHGYNTAILDDEREGDFIIAVFAVFEPESCDLYGLLIPFLPDNAVKKIEKGKSAVVIRLSAFLLSQEKLPLLLEAARVAANAARAAESKPLPVDFSIFAESGGKPLKPDTYIKTGRGAIGSVVGAAVSVPLCLMLLQLNPALFAWLGGGITAVIVISDFIYLAKDANRFGVVFCAVITAVSVLISAYSSARLGIAAAFAPTLAKSLVTAAAASVLFYALLFRPRKPKR